MIFYKKLLFIIILVFLVVSIYQLQSNNSYINIDQIYFNTNDPSSFNVTLFAPLSISIKHVYINDVDVDWFMRENTSLKGIVHLRINYYWVGGRNYTLKIITEKEDIVKLIKAPGIGPEIEIMNLKVTLVRHNRTIGTKILNDSIYWVPQSGSWGLEDNKYVLKSNGGESYLYYPLSDFIFQTRFKITSGCCAAIVFRKNTFYYQAELRNDADDFSIADSSNWDTRIAITSAKMPNTWLKMVIRANNSELKARLLSDNEIQIYGKSDAYPSGYFGLRAYNSRAEFSDIFITQITSNKAHLILNYRINSLTLSNITIIPYLLEVQKSTSNSSYLTIDIGAFDNISKNYTKETILNTTDSIISNYLSEDDIRPPDIIYFPTEPYNRTFAIRLIAKGWDDQKQEWVFKEFMSPEFTWEDVVEGRTIMADGNRPTE